MLFRSRLPTLVVPEKVTVAGGRVVLRLHVLKILKERCRDCEFRQYCPLEIKCSTIKSANWQSIFRTLWPAPDTIALFASSSMSLSNVRESCPSNFTCPITSSMVFLRFRLLLIAIAASRLLSAIQTQRLANAPCQCCAFLAPIHAREGSAKADPTDLVFFTGSRSQL